MLEVQESNAESVIDLPTPVEPEPVPPTPYECVLRLRAVLPVANEQAAVIRANLTQVGDNIRDCFEMLEAYAITRTADQLNPMLVEFDHAAHELLANLQRVLEMSEHIHVATSEMRYGADQLKNST